MKRLNSLHKIAVLLIASMIIAACSGGSGEAVDTVVVVQEEGEEGGIVYNGPTAGTDDVQNFKINIWDNLADVDRCGSCHVEGDQEPYFVRTDDINLAYSEANTVIDLSAPALSRMVTKVAEGHNCWRPQSSVCADIITNFIEAWATDSGADANVIVLTPPPEREVGSSKSFPVESGGFEVTVYPVVREYCVNCHSEDAAQQQQPFIASEDVEVAYQAARSKINLDDADASRLVLRLRNEFHNCWSNCTTNANEMRDAIAAFSAGIDVAPVNEDLIVSRSLGLPDGIVASSGGRVESNVVALYEFKTGEGLTAFDTSGVDPALDLNMTGNVEWIGSWGIRINDGKAQGSTSSSRKIRQQIGNTGEYSIEAWVVPDNVAQDGPARIVTYSGSSDTRNFTLGQTLYNYNFMSRSSNSDVNGMPMLSTPDADEVLQATLQHVVVNFDPIQGRSIYVNGEMVAEDINRPGNLNDWDDTFALAVGNEVDNQELWQGTLRLLAIHNRVLEPEEILQNFDAGVGEKFFLLFGVSHLIDMPQAYVVFQVQQFDNFGYLFDSPFFISLEDGATPNADIRIEGIRIGVNGQEAVIGQSYANLDSTINAGNYNSVEGVPLSRLGAIIQLDKGSEADEFFLTFDSISDGTTTSSFERPLDIIPPIAAGGDLEEQSDVALRNFAEINATMSAVTGIEETRVATIYNTVRQQLPTVESLDTFLAAHQSGIMQLSVAYCTTLMNDGDRVLEMFPGVILDNATAFDSEAGRNLLINPLLSALLVDVGLTTQPDQEEIRVELMNLMDNMSAANTRTTAIATCASATGSAVMLLQ
ncbi:MAG: hypothetical protein ACI93R_002377 [Flavobacteriales bacterium]|jgi:hypothetical protein